MPQTPSRRVIADLVDAALEASIVGSFTRIGPAVRRRLDRWAPLDALDASGRVAVVTGATSGIGREAAAQLARRGARVVIVARDPARAEATRVALGGADVVLADMGVLADVRRAADAIRALHPRVDALLHNAGALDAAWSLTPDGIERTVATHVVGPHLLTALLEPALTGGRVIWVTSGGMYAEPLDVAALDAGPDGYDGVRTYARAKRAQVALTGLWADRLADRGGVVHAMHPGWTDTPGVERSLPRFRALLRPLLRAAAEGADTLVWLALADGPPRDTTGGLWLDRRRRPEHRLAATRRADTPDARARLWAWADERAGLRPRAPVSGREDPGAEGRGPR